MMPGGKNAPAAQPVALPSAHLPVIALTVGEPAGIGPDLVAMAAQRVHRAQLVAIGDRDLLQARAARLGLPLCLETATARESPPLAPGRIGIDNVRLAVPARAGILDSRNARSVLATLEVAVTGCLSGRFDAMVTAPVHKGVINDAGIAFTGHTEFLAERAGAPRVVMLLAGAGLRVALATTHLPLQDVPRAITRKYLTETLRVLHRDLVQRFGIPAPCILVAGLNPHAGESGHLGREEIDIIVPVLDALRREGFDLVGPLPADTLFNRERLGSADCVLAMYHDQGLPVLKYASFGQGVNVTLGLPFVRTSVDHGTAIDRAGSGRCDPGSLIAAIDLAIELSQRRPTETAVSET